MKTPQNSPHCCTPSGRRKLHTHPLVKLTHTNTIRKSQTTANLGKKLNGTLIEEKFPSIKFE